MNDTTASGGTTASGSARGALILQAVRALFHLAAVVSVTAWGLVAWQLPYPGVLVAAGALVVSVTLWALFLSPKPVLHTDRFGQALIELLLLAAAVGALLMMGLPWFVPVPFGIAGAVVGYIATVPKKQLPQK